MTHCFYIEKFIKSSCTRSAMDPESVQQFVEITGANESTARHYLKLSDGNLENAISLIFECGADSDNIPSEEPSIRAPIPPKQEILVPPGPESSFFKPPSSVFDKFRDFAVETRRQEEQLASQLAGDSGISKEKMQRLEDLFRPPNDILSLGTFREVRDHAETMNRWLLVNVQNPQEFACQILNRDVWSNERIKEIVRDHFVFWQVLTTTTEGKRYIDFYKVTNYPYLGVIDPRTGECFQTLNDISVDQLIFMLNDILSSQPSPGSLEEDSIDSQQHLTPRSADNIPTKKMEEGPQEASQTRVFDKPSVPDKLDNGPISRLCLRLPSGEKENLSMSANDTIADFLIKTRALGYSSPEHSFKTAFPKTDVTAIPHETRLSETILFPSNTVFITKN